MKKLILTPAILLLFGIGLYAQPKAVGEPRVIAKTDTPLSEPVWSSDGTKLFFSSNEGLWEVSASGTGLRKAAPQQRATICTNPLLLQITDNPVGVASQVKALESLSGHMLYCPVLSPKGDKIVFQVSRGKGMYICDSDCQADASSLRSLGAKAQRATWMPDGKYIVVMFTEDDGHSVTKGELVSIDVATGAQNVLLSSDKYIAFNPAISPDGKKIAFEDFAEGVIYVMDIQ